jgi:hypothetical protein
VANTFDIMGFGALSEWNGQFSSASANQAFQTIAALGSNSIELTARIWTQTGTTDTVIADPAKTESDASLLAGFQAAHAAGLSVVFKAAVSPLDGTPTSSMAPTDVAAFFASYQAEIVHLATIAQAGGVETFAIGNEMSSLSGPQYLSYWTDLISAVRQVYHGDLTYAAATDEASKVSFWGELDAIGVNTYPPLTTNSTPTVQDLVNAWNEVPSNPYWAAAFENKSPVDFLHSLSEQYGKPVLMTEMGYRSMDGTAIEPGSWTINGTADPNAQADAYKAFFQVWSAQSGSWMKGVELWQWDLNNQYTSTGYSVMGKPAEAVVSQYFHGDGGATASNANGTVLHADGSRDVYTSGIIGKDYASEHDVINSAGDTTLIERFFADGGLAFTQALNSNGSVVDASYDDTGHLTQFATNYANGSFDQLAFNASGFETGETIRNADDSRDIYTYDIVGQDYTSQYTVADAAGHSVLIDDYRADGSLLLEQSVNASGIKTLDQYDSLGHLTEQTVTQKDGSYAVSSYASDGTLTSETLGHTDGSRDIYTYDIVGQDYTSQHTVTDAAGHSVLIEDYRADGSLLLEQTVDASGVKTLDQYDSLGQLTEQAVTQKDGSYTQSSYASDGTLTSETLGHTDGSRDIYSYDIAGQDYTSQHTVTDAAGHSVLIEDYRADGSLLLEQSVNASGVKTLDQYDSLGQLTEQTVTQKDGSYTQSSYASDGTLTSETLEHTDGTQEVDTYGITGQIYTARQDLMNASGHLVAIIFDNTDGSNTMTAYTSGVTLTATTANDVMNSAGGDTFVFSQASGHDIINNFRTGDAAGHDILQIAPSAAVDFAHLSMQIAGDDTVIDLGHGASVTLAGVVTPLTAHDVLIV